MSVNRYNQPISVLDTTDSVSKTSGSIITSGGIGTTKDVFVGNQLKLAGPSSTYTGIKAPSTSNNSSFTLPNQPPSISNQFMVCDDQGNLSFTPGLMNITHTFSGNNNQSSAADITGLLYTSGSFEIDLTINVVATTNLSELVKLSGISNPTTGWSLNSLSITGDDTGVSFTIDAGQIKYTSSSYTGFTSIIFSWTEVNSSTISTNLTSGTATTGTVSSLGNFFTVNGSSFTDSATAGSGTIAKFSSVHIGTPTLNATNTLVTTTVANTLFIEGPPTTGTNETITTPYSLNINSGNSRFGGNVNITGSISKGSGTFEITHPLDESKILRHSFIEGPRCDNIYRGKARLLNGNVSVNIDKECTQTDECSMTPGTFDSLNTNISFFLQNNDTFDRVIGNVTNGILEIQSENVNSNALINWMVIGERRDQHIIQWKNMEN